MIYYIVIDIFKHIYVTIVDGQYCCNILMNTSHYLIFPICLLCRLFFCILYTNKCTEPSDVSVLYGVRSGISDNKW